MNDLTVIPILCKMKKTICPIYRNKPCNGDCDIIWYLPITKFPIPQRDRKIGLAKIPRK